jgi:hypothetical protein
VAACLLMNVCLNSIFGCMKVTVSFVLASQKDGALVFDVSGSSILNFLLTSLTGLASSDS